MTTVNDDARRAGSTEGNSAQARPTPARRRAENITSKERAGRIAIGLLTIIAGAVLLTGAGSVLAVTLEILLIAAGLDLVVTGAAGRCPLYRALGYTPPSLRRSP